MNAASAGYLLLIFSTVLNVPSGVTAAEDEFPLIIEDQIGGRLERLTWTGTGVRKKIRIALYRIAGYCDDDVRPVDVDALADADAPKRLILIMERDIADWLLRQGFEEAFRVNDPKGRFGEPSKKLLDYLSATSLKGGTSIVLTHIPGVGVQCRVHDRATLTIKDKGFAHLCWKMFMGPHPVTPEVRAGLGSQLPSSAKN